MLVAKSGCWPMKVIIQCAASKADNAGFLTTQTDRRVKFVARPDEVPRSEEWHYARPDDPSDLPEQSWRQQLERYNEIKNDNPSGLLKAYRLYQDSVYDEMVTKYGADNVFILSAGWGLVRSDYLLPMYDITFTARAEPYKRRRPHDKYKDFCDLHDDKTGRIVFFGCKGYHALLQNLTDRVSCEKVVFYPSYAADPPKHPGWRAVRFETTIRTNWHYACARMFLKGKISI